MADFLKNFFGGQGSAQSPIPAAAEDADFADFASAPDPSPVNIVPVISTESIAASATPTLAATALPIRPYTKWYRVWERVELRDFYAEMFIIPFLLVVVALHLWGTRANKRRAKSWITAHAPILQQEFSTLGFSNRVTRIDERSFQGPNTLIPPGIMKERSKNEYITYATGRQNVAYVDVKLSLAKRYNPMALLAENVLGFVVESMPAPKERLEATAYVFDGREYDYLPSLGGKTGTDAPEVKREKFNSTYDGFVWAVVHKDSMQFLRDGRYDLSLTTTKDHPKLPNWSTVMSESAEITETILTPDLVSAIKQAGEALVALVISDQPIDKPQKLNEAIPKKRISLILRVPKSYGRDAHAATLPLFTQFIRLPDLLVSAAHFRPEVIRRVRATREEEMNKIKKVDEVEKAEERRLKGEKEKRTQRDDKLKGMSAEEQKKFLEKERTVEQKRTQKKRSIR